MVLGLYSFRSVDFFLHQIANSNARLCGGESVVSVALLHSLRQCPLEKRNTDEIIPPRSQAAKLLVAPFL